MNTQIENNTDLRALDPIDVFKLAMERSNKPAQVIAAELGCSVGSIRRTLSTDKYFPSFPDIPKFCAVVGNTLVIQWLNLRAMDIEEPDHASVDCVELLNRVGELFTETGEVGFEVKEAIKDGKLEPHELRKVIKEVSDVAQTSTILIGDLRHLERKLAKQEKQNKGE